ncbi:hypothetical protein [Xanthomonas fragariae]
MLGWNRLTKVAHLVTTWLVHRAATCRRCGSRSPLA